MLDDLLGNMNAGQEQLEEKLKDIEIVEDSPHGEISISVNGKKEIQDISINKEFEDQSELEDLLVLTLNSAFAKVDKLVEMETQKLLESMLPGGLSGLFGQ